MTPNQIKGRLFEICILKLVLKSGYKLVDIDDIDKTKYRHERKGFVEFKGRGEYHQIDVPVDLVNNPSFIYPIRLLGEVKCYRKRVSKDVVRQEIGKMKDIQENYFVGELLTENMRARRRTELFTIFSISGFDDAAERLAYAHNIKTISYANIPCIEDMASIIYSVSDMLSRLRREELKNILDNLFDSLILEKTSIDKEARTLIDYFEGIKTCIIASTSTGLVVHFLSYEEFPDDLFPEQDHVFCKIHGSFENDNWVLELDNSNVKLYFSMPEIIKKDCFIKDGNYFYPKKETEFAHIYFDRVINGKQRRLEFRFNSDWFHKLALNYFR